MARSHTGEPQGEISCRVANRRRKCDTGHFTACCRRNWRSVDDHTVLGDRERGSALRSCATTLCSEISPSKLLDQFAGIGVPAFSALKLPHAQYSRILLAPKAPTSDLKAPTSIDFGALIYSSKHLFSLKAPTFRPQSSRPNCLSALEAPTCLV